MTTKTIKVGLYRSPVGTQAKHRLCVKGLGLKKMWQVRELVDTPSVRGLVNKVSYMVRIVEEQ